MADIRPFRAIRYARKSEYPLSSLIAPPYDVSDMTAQLGARAIMDVLGTMVEEGHLGTRPQGEARARREHEAKERERREAEGAGEGD